jgi:hypothetical protein
MVNPAMQQMALAGPATLFNPSVSINPRVADDIRAMADAIVVVEDEYREQCLKQFGPEAIAAAAAEVDGWEDMSWGMRYWALSGCQK